MPRLYYMITKAYRDYIRSPRWRRKRQEVFAYYGKKCFACRRYKRILHVHHLSYTNLGHEPMSDLIPLCIDCHKQITKIYRSNRRRGLRRVTMEFVKMKQAKRL